MGAIENKQRTKDAYAAFGVGDAEGALSFIGEKVRWNVRGHNALSGAHTGKAAVAELWAGLAAKGFRTEPHEFIAEGDRVIVLTTAHLDGETVETVDVLDFDADGMVIAFDTIGSDAALDRAFAAGSESASPAS
jgi:uncharacterized protein